MSANPPLLMAQDLRVTFGPARQRLVALDGLSLAVQARETVGLVGESGSGKSTLALTLMRARRPDSGRIVFDGIDIADLTPRQLLPVRRRLQIIFQDPYASLDPRMTARQIVAEPLRAHRTGSRAVIDARVLALMEAVGLAPDMAGRLPAEFSGGQRQRIAIARALALDPAMLIADEPVSALDVSVQAQVVSLLRDIQQRLGITYLVIAHDLAFIHQISDRIVVMYLGRVVEEGTADAVVGAPQHPYTVALLSATPVPDIGARRERIVLPGDPPSAIDRPSGCAFHPRCPIRQARCAIETPPLSPAPQGGRVACFYPGTLPSPWPRPEPERPDIERNDHVPKPDA